MSSSHTVAHPSPFQLTGNGRVPHVQTHHTPPPAPSEYGPLIDNHGAQVLRSRAIPLEIAAECGIYTEGEAMRILHYDTEGDVWAIQRRPHNRRKDAPKYLFDAGTKMRIHVPPSEREKLRNVMITIIATESALKAAAIIAALRRFGLADQYAVISIPGVTTWQRDGTAIPDFEYFPSRQKERGKIVYRRPFIIAFDSNAATNPDVILARWKLTEYLRDVRKHDVQWIDVPEGPGDTPKARERGIDDVLAEQISTMPVMLASAYPAPTIMPEIDLEIVGRDGLSEVERLRIENAVLKARAERAERHVSLLTRFAVSPHYTENEKTLIIRAAGCAMSDGAHEPLEDGAVKIDAGKISNDFRPTDKEHPDYETYKRSPVNPLGDHWYMRRSSVVPTIKSLEKKLGKNAPIHAQPAYVREPGDPSPHRVSIITMQRPDNMVDFLDAVNRYRPDAAPERPYMTQPPCPHCGEVHSRTRRTFCDGCEQEIEKPQHLPIPPANDPNATPEQREDLAVRTAAAAIIDAETGRPIDPTTGEVMEPNGPTPVNRENLFTEKNDPLTSLSPAGSPLTSYSENICLPAEPALPAVNLCACGAPLPDGSKWTCGPDCPAGRMDVAS